MFFLGKTTAASAKAVVVHGVQGSLGELVKLMEDKQSGGGPLVTVDLCKQKREAMVVFEKEEG